MNDMDQSEISGNEKHGSYYALLVAFRTMNERCRQLEKRLGDVEEENMCLRLECGKDESAAITKLTDSSEKTIVQTLKEKVEELTKQKSQLTHQIFMVAAENRQLWNRLRKLNTTNKSLGSQLTKISDTLKQHSPAQQSSIVSYNFNDLSDSMNQEDDNQHCELNTNSDEKDQSLEEISRRLINSIMLEKSNLEEQYAEMVELQNGTKQNLQTIGFTYPEDSDTDLELLKQHDIRLLQMRSTLIMQQTKLKRALQNFKKMKEGITCNNCRTNANKKMCQTGTQLDSDESFKEHGATQTSLQTTNLSSDRRSNAANSDEQENRTCPLCESFYGKGTSFADFHEHVLSHFTKEISVE